MPYLGFNALFFMMLLTGKTHRYRSLLFILVAVALPIDFISFMVETYGSMLLTEEHMYSTGASFCPLTMPMVLVPALVEGRYRVLVTFIEPTSNDSARPAERSRFWRSLGAWQDERPIEATLKDIRHVNLSPLWLRAIMRADRSGHLSAWHRGYGK